MVPENIHNPQRGFFFSLSPQPPGFSIPGGIMVLPPLGFILTETISKAVADLPAPIEAHSPLALIKLFWVYLTALLSGIETSCH